MERLQLNELAARADELDAAVVETPEIDRFCSSSAWILSAAEALMPQRPSEIRVGRCGYFTAMRGTHRELPYLEPMELSWGLGCPLLGRDVQGLVDELAEDLGRRDDWAICLVPGLPSGGQHERALARPGLPWLWRRGAWTTSRYVASLDGGLDGFLGRRTANFRKSLHKSARAARAAGIEVVRAPELEAAEPGAIEQLYERIMAVEAGSWKSLSGNGIVDGPMREFYAAMLPRLAARGRARVMFARHQGQDVGYILGAVFDGTYRGLQFSYRDDYARYSVGSLCQLEQITALCEEGVLAYDLGTERDYKARWAEEMFTTELQVLVAER
jgi:Acetyltransferase (GNAT) domain